MENIFYLIILVVAALFINIVAQAQKRTSFYDAIVLGAVWNDTEGNLINAHGGGMLLFQYDWASNFTKNGHYDLLWTINFGAGADIERQFARLKELRPNSPLMCSEYWSGWFDKWGQS